LDPDDALITLAFMRYLSREKREELYKPFMGAHPWFALQREKADQTMAGLDKVLNGRTAFALEGEPAETTLHLIDLRGETSTTLRGFGLELSIEGGHPLHLLLDTGASGILIRQRAVDKAGLNHIGSNESWGIGDGGVRKGFVAVAESCKIGSLRYKTCVLQSLEGKRIGGEEDGLIGTDVFSDYLIQLDFQRRALHLTPLPHRQPSSEGYDRTVTPDKADFTLVFRFGHFLCVPTKVNGKTSGLFLIDTGAATPMIDSTFAALSTKLHSESDLHIRGVSGNVKDVFEADKAELEFAHFRQRNLGLTAIDINNSPRPEEVRLAGILGLPVLVMFRLTLDYRDGLVKFDYVQ
jgi:predicted aspartyl protease